MNPNSLSNDHAKILDFLETENSITNIFSPDLSASFKLLISFLKKELLKGKSFILQHGNGRDSDHLVEMLANSGLDRISLKVGQESLISRERLFIESEKDKDFLLESFKSKILYQKNIEHLEELQGKYNEPVFGEYNRTKLAELLYLARQRKGSSNLDLQISNKNYLFNKKEFWNLRGRIEKAASNYKQQYTYLKLSDQLSSNVYKDFHLIQNREVIFRYLNKFLLDSGNLISRYEKIFKCLKIKIQKQYKDKVRELEALIESLELQLEYYSIEKEFAPVKKAFSKQDPLEKIKVEVRAKYGMVLELLSDIKLFSVETPTNSWTPDTLVLADFSRNLKKIIKSAHFLILAKVEEEIEVVNNSNYESSDLKEILELQEDLILGINNAHLLKDNIQNLSISSWQSFMFLKSVETRLQNSLIFLQSNSSYCIWRSYEMSLEHKALDIINAFENLQSDAWVEEFELWYFQSLFDRFEFITADEIRKLAFELEESKFIYHNFDEDRMLKVIENSFYNLPTDEQNSWNKYIKKELSDHDGAEWETAIERYPKAFNAKFPLLIGTDNSLSVLDKNKVEYDYLICFEPDEIQLNYLTNTHFQGISIFRSTLSSKQEFERIVNAKNYAVKKKFELQPLNFPDHIHKELPLKEKLKTAKILANVLAESSTNKCFFSARNYSIISCVNPFCERLLAQELSLYPLKELKYNDLKSGIVEDVLLKEDKVKLLILQDGFFDSKLNAEWQFELIRSIERMGINVKFIDVFEMARGNKNKVLDFIDISELKILLEESNT